MKDTRSAKPAAAADKVSVKLSDDERAALRDHVKELRLAARRGPKENPEEAEAAVLAKIADMADSDRAMAERLHGVILASVPGLTSRLWYGMPAYSRERRMICFFQPGQKFKTRYGTLGFSDSARLDEGAMWPTSYALTKLTAEVEARITELVKRAAG